MENLAKVLGGVYLLCWIVTYPVDKVICSLNNWGLVSRIHKLCISVKFIPVFRLSDQNVTCKIYRLSHTKMAQKPYSVPFGAPHTTIQLIIIAEYLPPRFCRKIVGIVV